MKTENDINGSLNFAEDAEEQSPMPEVANIPEDASTPENSAPESVNEPDDGARVIPLAVEGEVDAIDPTEKLIKHLIATLEAGNDDFSPLAALSSTNYERVRGRIAKELDVRVRFLDETYQRVTEPTRTREGQNVESQTQLTRNDMDPPDLLEDTVDGGSLMADLVEIFGTYVIMPLSAKILLALFVLHTFAHHVAFVSPLIVITAPEKRSGKTTLLRLLRYLVCRPQTIAHISTASLFRLISQVHPTLLMDEADTWMSNGDFIGMLNSGHCRDDGLVFRFNAETGAQEGFDLWAPKVVAMIGRLPDTTMDRAIEISLRRKLKNEKTENFRIDRTDHLRELQQRAYSWVEQNLDRIIDADDPVVPEVLHDRAADNLRPLLMLAELIDEGWAEKAREAAVSLTPVDEEESVTALLLGDIRTVFKITGDRVSSKELCRTLNAMEERPWGTYHRGSPVSPSTVATLLKGFGIRPKDVKIAGKSLKGYEREAFEDAFARYLYPE